MTFWTESYHENKPSPLRSEKHNRTISASRKEQQSDSRDARPVEINDWARAEGELLAIEVQGVSKRSSRWDCEKTPKT